MSIHASKCRCKSDNYMQRANIMSPHMHIHIIALYNLYTGNTGVCICIVIYPHIQLPHINWAY